MVAVAAGITAIAVVVEVVTAVATGVRSFVLRVAPGCSQERCTWEIRPYATGI